MLSSTRPQAAGWPGRCPSLVGIAAGGPGLPQGNLLPFPAQRSRAGSCMVVKNRLQRQTRAPSAPGAVTPVFTLGPEAAEPRAEQPSSLSDPNRPQATAVTDYRSATHWYSCGSELNLALEQHQKIDMVVRAEKKLKINFTENILLKFFICFLTPIACNSTK